MQNVFVNGVRVRGLSYAEAVQVHNAGGLPLADWDLSEAQCSLYRRLLEPACAVGQRGRR